VSQNRPDWDWDLAPASGLLRNRRVAMEAYLRSCEPRRGETAMLASFLLVAAMAFFITAAAFLPIDPMAWR